MKKGFTLIEVIIYLALFSIVIGGGMVATYQILGSSNSSSNQVILQEEANFLLRKIDWGMTGATVATPATIPPSLTITKAGYPTLKFDLNSTNLRLTRGAGLPLSLNSSSISVSGLSFIAIGNGITTQFTLTTVQDGRNVSQTFSTTKYLRI